MGTAITGCAIVKLSEAQAYLRIDEGEEEALLAGMIRTASALCESFINQVVIARDFETEIDSSGCWGRVPLTPVRSITAVEGVDAAGNAAALASDAYAVDIDSAGDGWVRVIRPDGLSRIRVRGTAGMADDENGVPEPIRQGVLRLVAHMFSDRDGDGGQPPAAVTALWRPYRRLRMA